MKTFIVLAFLLPFLFHGLRTLVLYVFRFRENKCKSCPIASACLPKENTSCCTPSKKNFS